MQGFSNICERTKKTFQNIRKERATIEQIKNGFADYYYLTKDGKVWSEKTKQYLTISYNHRYKLQKADGEQTTISLKELYSMIYNKIFCIDNIKDLKGEKWKEIAETNGMYFISNMGRIKSYYKYEAVILKPSITKAGYERLQIKQYGLILSKYIHILVATAFEEDCGKPLSADWQVHHLDFNKRNNCSNNLKWVSLADHLKYHNKKGIEENGQ